MKVTKRYLPYTDEWEITMVVPSKILEKLFQNELFMNAGDTAKAIFEQQDKIEVETEYNG